MSYLIHCLRYHICRRYIVCVSSEREGCIQAAVWDSLEQSWGHEGIPLLLKTIDNPVLSGPWLMPGVGINGESYGFPRGRASQQQCYLKNQRGNIPLLAGLIDAALPHTPPGKVTHTKASDGRGTIRLDHPLQHLTWPQQHTLQVRSLTPKQVIDELQLGWITLYSILHDPNNTHSTR